MSAINISGLSSLSKKVQTILAELDHQLQSGEITPKGHARFRLQVLQPYLSNMSRAQHGGRSHRQALPVSRRLTRRGRKLLSARFFDEEGFDRAVHTVTKSSAADDMAGMPDVAILLS